MATIDILLPTCNRVESLITALSGVATQKLTDIRLVVSDQSDKPVEERPVVQSLVRVIEARGGTVEWHYRVPSKGVVEQREFLLKRAHTSSVLYLDDDVLMEPGVANTLLQTLRHSDCGFVGAFPAGLSFRRDVRPEQQVVEYWDGPVEAETIEPDTPAWQRWQLHRAANLWHLSRHLRPDELRLYKVAWVTSCVMYDREKLMQ